MKLSEDHPSHQAIRQSVICALDKKAEDLLILDVSEQAHFTDYFFMMTVQTSKQAQAISNAILKAMKDEGMKPLHKEGYSTGSWILLDFVDFIIHIFQSEPRDFYALERLWGDAPDVTERFLP